MGTHIHTALVCVQCMRKMFKYHIVALTRGVEICLCCVCCLGEVFYRVYGRKESDLWWKWEIMHIDITI